MTCSSGWDSSSSASHGDSTATVADKHAGKVVGEPYRGTPDFRFDEGAGGIADTWASTETLHGHSESARRSVCTKVLLYWTKLRKREHDDEVKERRWRQIVISSRAGS